MNAVSPAWARLASCRQAQQLSGQPWPHRSVSSFLRSFRWAIQGIAQVIATQRNMRIHLAAVVAVTVLALWLGLSPVEWAVLILTITLVLSLETLNTAVEATVDRISLEEHPRAKLAKDAAAGAVLIAAAGAVLVGFALLGPKLLDQLAP